MNALELSRKIWPAIRDNPAFKSLLEDESDRPYIKTFIIDRLPAVLEGFLPHMANIGTILAAKEAIMIDLIENWNVVKHAVTSLEPGDGGDWFTDEEMPEIFEFAWRLTIEELAETAKDLRVKADNLALRTGEPKASLATVLSGDLDLSSENAAAAANGNMTIGQLLLTQPEIFFRPFFL